MMDSMDVTPGKLNDGGADTGPPIAVVTADPARAAAYLAQAPIGQYVVVQDVADVPGELALGGIALLDGTPLEPALLKALEQAVLR
jgi:hypothetical protein